MAKPQPHAGHAVHAVHGATLSRRERQIMDILYRRGRATAGDVMEQLAGDPSYSTVRTQLRVLEDKGHVRHEEEGLRYVYMPGVPRLAAAIVCAALAPAAARIAPAWHVAFAGRSAPPPPVAQRAVPPAPVVVLSETITVTPSPSLPAPSERWSVGRIVFATWLAGALLCLAILAIGFTRLTWIASPSR